MNGSRSSGNIDWQTIASHLFAFSTKNNETAIRGSYVRRLDSFCAWQLAT